MDDLPIKGQLITAKLQPNDGEQATSHRKHNLTYETLCLWRLNWDGDP